MFIPGRVVGIIRRKWRQYCGILLPSVLAEGTRHLFVPAERKIPKIRIETRQAASLSSQKIIVAIDSWPRTSRYPLGHFVRGLGNIGDKDTENEVKTDCNVLSSKVNQEEKKKEQTSLNENFCFIVTGSLVGA